MMASDRVSAAVGGIIIYPFGNTIFSKRGSEALESQSGEGFEPDRWESHPGLHQGNLKIRKHF